MFSIDDFDQDYDVKPGRTGMEFRYKLRFTNTMPDLPCETKFISIDTLHPSRFKNYYNSHLEQSLKMELDFGLELGIHTELADVDIYAVDPMNSVRMHPSDAFLVEDEIKISTREQKRADVHRKPVPFMRKAIAKMSYRRMGGVGKERPETQIGYGMAMKGEIPEILYQNRTEQIAAIEKTFEDVKRPIEKHYKKQGVYAVEECPILPDFSNFKFTTMQVTFDKNPVPDITEGLRNLALENSYICDMHGILGHFTATDETLQRLLEENEEGKEFDRTIPLEYVLNRDYTGIQQPVKENFYLTKAGNDYKFGPLGSHSVILSRVRRAGKDRMGAAKLEITRRNLSDVEFKEWRKRMNSLVERTGNDSMDSDQDTDRYDQGISTQENVDSDYESSDKEITPPPQPVVKKEEDVRQETESSNSDDSDDSSEESSSPSDDSDEDSQFATPNAHKESPPATPGRFNAGAESDVPMQSTPQNAVDLRPTLNSGTPPVMAFHDPSPSAGEYEPAFPYISGPTTDEQAEPRDVKQELPDYD